MLTYANICKHEHEKNMIKLCYKIVPKTNVEQIEGNERGPTPIYTLQGPRSRKLPRRFLCVHKMRKLLGNLHN
jgi:hypothetical protein